MTNRPKQRGTAFETEVVNYLKAHGFPYAERRALRGSRDCGDVSGIPGIVVEVKNVRALALGEWAKEATAEAANEGVRRWIVVHKRRQHSTADAYATLPLWLLVELLADEPTEAVGL